MSKKSSRKKYNLKKYAGLTAVILSIMMAVLSCVVLVPEKSIFAKDKFISNYIQTVYNQKNGIGSNEVNCLYQSSSGYIWIGTDGGLYRSNGSDFQSINLWDTDRTDVYSINCILQDSTGRMWIGTNNYGLFYIEGGENYHLQDEYYNGIKKILDVCQTEDGTIFVTTENGLYTVVSNEDKTISLAEYNISNLSNADFISIVAYDNTIWAINGSSYIYIIEDEKCKIFDASEICSNDLRCIKVFGDKIYVGTAGNDVLCFEGTNNYQLFSTTVDGVNSILVDNNEYVWVCADNGFGYFDQSGTFTRITDSEIDNYLSDMIQDYEGNYWISSTRMGVLLLSKSKFTDFNINTGMNETIVNCVYMHRGSKYIGTDDGLIIFDNKNERVENDLTSMLNGISVRNIMSDSDGNLCISTYRRYGLVMYNQKGEITNISRTEGIPSSSINCTIGLKNGDIVVCTTRGIAIVDKDKKIKTVINRDNGLEFENVLCAYQKDDNHIFLGTDGGGLYECDLISGDISNYNTENGLNSNVISCIKEGTEGIWLGTDNGLCFYNESFRNISNIEFSNSIYDIIFEKGSFWIICSKGVLRTSEEELLGSGGLQGRYFDVEDGLTKTINPYSNSTIDSSGRLFVCCNTGICVLDTNNISYNTVAPKIKVTAVDIDGKRYEFDDLNDGLKIRRDASRITIYFAVFSYSNRSNIKVEYSLKGFDSDPIVISGNGLMEAVYTNLDGGVYEFFISAYNGDGVKCETEVSFIIEKEKKFLEQRLARLFMVFLVIMGIAIVIFGFIRISSILKSKEQALEEISKEHEQVVKSSSAKNDYLANMSNEIKTPINSILAKADELLHLIPADADYIENVQGIFDTGNDILLKVDDIILLAKIEAGKCIVANELYSISSIAYEISEHVVAKIAEKPVKFFVEIGENISDNFLGDATKIKEILMRLIDNSVRFTKEGSITLSIDCYEMAESQEKKKVNLVFTVSDTGIGIPEDRIDNIFEVYNIVDNKMKNTHAGNGIGLAIAKGYVDLLEGEIEVSSVYGAGSSFTISISQTIAESIHGERFRAKIEEFVSKEDAEKLWLPEVSALLVDDDEVSREVAQKVLSQFELKVDIATSGVSAIDMVMNRDYDVVFMNLSMPIMSGLDAMREIRELEGDRYLTLPIISMDTNAIEERKDELLGEGFTDTLVKPIELRRVAAILKDCLPSNKVLERSNDIAKYIEGSRYRDGLVNLEPEIDVESAVEKIGGSIEVFNKLVLAYYNQNQDAVVLLYDMLDKNIRGFKKKIHSLRATSANIGAYSLAQAATRIEAAINIGNREYVHNNIGDFTDELLDILYLIENYVKFIESVSGMTDEEYASMASGENNVSYGNNNVDAKGQEDEILAPDSIDFHLLETIKYAALEGNYEVVDDTINKIFSCNIVGEDREFIEVLKQAIDKRSLEEIDELVTTYMDLKL